MMSTSYLFLVLAVALQLVSSFFGGSGRVQMQLGTSCLQMGGGKSQAEKAMTTRTMFKELRSKINEAAAKPGFFDTADSNLDLELLLKSNRDGTQIGDCPFAQFLQLVMMKKGLKYKLTPTSASNKPAWLVEKHAGKLPALLHKGTPMVDSLAIAEYLEKTFPVPSLTRQGSYSYQEVLEKTSGFFPALSAFIKNKDTAKDAGLSSALEAQLDLMDEVIRSTPGQFMCGVELTLADLYLVPQVSPSPDPPHYP